MARRSVLVIGGGIGGLTHAIAAAQAGHNVEVIEARPNWDVAGWGLSLTGPALRALRAVSLDEACLAAGFPIRRTLHCDAAGEVRAVMDPPSLLGQGEPVEAGMARPVQHRLLRECAEKSGATLRTGSTVTELQEGTDAITAHLSDGGIRTVDYIVGADGVRSQTRAQLGLKGEPWYTGQMVWRALVDRPAWATEINTFAGPEGSTGLIPISQKKAYIFLTEGTPVPTVVPEEELADRMRALLAPFSGRFAGARDSITDPSQVVRRPVHALIVDGPWHAGRGVLLGDAAHSPSPQMVSGAALAIEDAVVLAEEVTRHDDLAGALSAYEERRLDRARNLVATSLEIARADLEGRRDEYGALMGKGHAAMAAPI